MNTQLTYGWNTSTKTNANQYIFPTVLQHIPKDKILKILDIGCGNGSLAGELSKLGHTVTALDVSEDGIAIAQTAYPQVKFAVASVYDDDFRETVGNDFDYVISLEVIEHLYWPKKLIERCHDVLKKDGHLIVSAPYHGFLKNLALSVFNGWDRHFTVNWDGGHIKFFSRATLTDLLLEKSFRDITFEGVGRIPGLWKSMILTGTK